MIRIFLVTLAALLLWVAPEAQAGSRDGWYYELDHVSPRYREPARRKKSYNRRHGKRYDRGDINQYRSAIIIDEDDEKIWDCKPPVRGVGTQWIGTEGAMDAARKDWMERTRFDYGENWLDMANAQGPYGASSPISSCGRTSIGETMGQVLYRCTIIARPCKPQMVEVPGKTK
jgi:hypothetical protein